MCFTLSGVFQFLAAVLALPLFVGKSAGVTLNPKFSMTSLTCWISLFAVFRGWVGSAVFFNALFSLAASPKRTESSLRRALFSVSATMPRALGCAPFMNSLSLFPPVLLRFVPGGIKLGLLGSAALPVCFGFLSKFMGKPPYGYQDRKLHVVYYTMWKELSSSIFERVCFFTPLFAPARELYTELSANVLCASRYCVKLIRGSESNPQLPNPHQRIDDFSKRRRSD